MEIERRARRDARVESDADFSQEHLGVAASQGASRDFADFAEEVARQKTRLGIDSGKCELVVLRLEVALLLLAEGMRKIVDNGCRQRFA